jgi:hypothetical protein
MAPPKLLLSRSIDIEYHQFYVDSEDGGYIDMDRAYAGMANGLCGAGSAGRLFLTTGAQNGPVEVSVILFESAPELDDYWEDVVEVSLRAGPRLMLAQWGYEKKFSLAIPPGQYRVRYCAMGMDEEMPDTLSPGGSGAVQSYCLQFWPAPAGPDVILKTTAKTAFYWHAEKTRPPADKDGDS